MTVQKSFKRIVRARMEKTGESYTAARASLLTQEPNGSGPSPTGPLATSDEKIRERTGRGWEAWFDRLDAWGAAERTHREIAKHVAEELGLDPLAWNAQAIAGSYELARGLKVVGQKEDGFAVTASKTVGVPVEVLFAAVVDSAERGRWLAGDELAERTATAPRSARFDWGDGSSRVHVAFEARDDGRSRVALSHERLPDAAEAERMKTQWRAALATLKEVLEA